MNDPCIVSADTCSTKETALKNRLYKKSLNSTTSKQPPQSDIKQTVRAMQTLSTQENNQNMANFLKEIGTQLNDEKSKSLAPNSLIYQQSRVIEKQLQLCEESQKQMGQFINKVGNKNSNDSLIEKLYKGQSQLFSQTVAPLIEKLGESKQMHMETIKNNEALQNKLEEIKETIRREKQVVYNPRVAQPAIIPQYLPESDKPAINMQAAPDLSNVKTEISKLDEMMATLENRSNTLGEAMHNRISKLIAESQQVHTLAATVGFGASSKRESLPEFDYYGLTENVSTLINELSQIKIKFLSTAIKLPAITKISAKANYNYDVEPLLQPEKENKNKKPNYLNAIITSTHPCIAEIKLPPPTITSILSNTSAIRDKQSKKQAKTKPVNTAKKATKEIIEAKPVSEHNTPKSIQASATKAIETKPPQEEKKTEPTKLQIKELLNEALKEQVAKENEPVNRKLNMVMASPQAKLDILSPEKQDHNKEDIITALLVDELKPAPKSESLNFEDKIFDLLASELTKQINAPQIEKPAKEIKEMQNSPYIATSNKALREEVKEEAHIFTLPKSMKEEQTNTSIVTKSVTSNIFDTDKRDPSNKKSNEKPPKIQESIASVSIVSVQKKSDQRILEIDIKDNKEDEALAIQEPFKVETMISSKNVNAKNMEFEADSIKSTKNANVPNLELLASGTEVYKFTSDVSSVSSMNSLGRNDSYSSMRSEGSRYSGYGSDYNPQVDPKNSNKASKEKISINFSDNKNA